MDPTDAFWKALEEPNVKIAVTFSFILFIDFLWRFALRGMKLRQRLTKLNRSIAKLKKPVNPSDLNKIFAKQDHISLLWTEFSETLHYQSQLPGPSDQIPTVRATVPADVFFSGQSVVEGHLYAEYFKHVPGILTGIGIIGTFYGIVQGLHVYALNTSSVAKIDEALRVLQRTTAITELMGAVE